jgi:hypothetical protein
MTSGRVIARIRDEASQIARAWSGPGASPTWRLTASLFDCLANDPRLLELAAAIPPERLPPLLFAASVQRVVARRRDHRFAAYYPVPGGDQPPLDDQFAERYCAFCLEHRDELAEVQSRHIYQMNEVARCAQVALALGVVQRMEPGRQLALVDVGTGSGLGLYLDGYRYALSDGRQWGASDSPVDIDCELRGHLRPLLPPTGKIDHRVGIDLNPLDLDDPEERAWLEACIPPEAGALRRVAGAIEVARAGDAPIIRGDAHELLSDVLRAVPAGLLVVVVDSFAAVFFDEAMQQDMSEVISRLGRERDVAWIALDPLVPLGTRARRTVQGLDAPSRLVEQNRRGGAFAALSLVAYLDGTASSRLLASAHPSGTRMEWLDGTSAL